MERLYNPDLMPEEEIKGTFVARQNVVDDLVSLIKHQPNGAGVQHAVIIAPRGMGKTTVLLMFRFAIQDSALSKKWQTVQFPEERYSIYDLADFWIEILRHLDDITGDAEFHQRIETLHIEYPDKDNLQEAALALIKDWRRKHKKRLVVLVDNFDMILEQINDERDNARLRDVLMNDGTMMLIGGATTFFHEARAYDQPLYNFFKLYDLPHLRFEEMQDLLRRRAALDEREDFEKTLKENKSRLRVLEHFTGGNPRLVIMLYRVVTQSDISEVRFGLEKLLDEVTPYYKSKVESLPPQQRKILDHIARVSSQTNEGLTPGEIATATRMSPNQASAQLKRLVEHGYVQAANLRGRSSYYTLSERLYAIWHQMRFGRNARERMAWLVSILKAIYDSDEMNTQSNILETRFYEHLNGGRFDKAGDALEHWKYLLEAMKDSPNCRSNIELSNAKARSAAFSIAYQRGLQFLETSEWSNSLEQFDRALENNNLFTPIYFIKGRTLLQLERFEEAITCFDTFLETIVDYSDAWLLRGVALAEMGHFEKAIDSFEHIPDDSFASLESDSTLPSLVDLIKFYWCLQKNKFELAMVAWIALQQKVSKLSGDDFIQVILEILISLAQNGRFALVHQLIEVSVLADRFFPLARAIDYIQTGDEVLLEKLSPEVRGVVDEIVAQLRHANNQLENPRKNSRTRRLNTISSRRTQKQLR